MHAALTFPGVVLRPESTGLRRETGEAADALAPLIARVRADDLSAFDALYRRTRNDVHRTLYPLVGSNSDMDDLIQESFIQLLKALRTFRGDCKFSTFLYRVCANVALMHLRRGRRHPEDPVDELPTMPTGASSSPEHTAQVSQAAHLLQQALDKLTAEKRVVFVYHEFMGMGPEEIAEVLSIPTNTVRSRLGRARLELTEAVVGLRRELEGVGS